MNPQHFTLAGGGLAGALLAVLLARRGHTVTIFEKRKDPRKTALSAGRSINLALAARGIKALETAGLFERIKPLLVPMPGRLLHSPDGELTYLAYGSRSNEVNWSVSRSGLNLALIDAAVETGRVTLAFEHTVTDRDVVSRTLTVVDTSTGERKTLAAPTVIATDGAGSAVREALRSRYGVKVSHEALAHAYKELTIAATPEGDWAMRHDALHIWPRGSYMLIALPNPDKTFTVTLFMPTERFGALDTVEKVSDFFAEHFSDAARLITSLSEDFFANPTGSLGTVRCHPYTDPHGTTALLGDAAHAIVPFHGQGMNAAFEDCVSLDRAIAHCGNDLGTAFRAYSSEREPNAEAIADMALENYIEMRDTVREPKFALRKQLGFMLETRHPTRFVPRYSMVMFHAEISYAEAQRRGAVQSEILDSLTQGKDTVTEVDLDLADRLVTERLPPLAHFEPER